MKTLACLLLTLLTTLPVLAENWKGTVNRSSVNALLIKAKNYPRATPQETAAATPIGPVTLISVSVDGRNTFFVSVEELRKIGGSMGYTDVSPTASGLMFHQGKNKFEVKATDTTPTQKYDFFSKALGRIFIGGQPYFELMQLSNQFGGIQYSHNQGKPTLQFTFPQR